MTQAAYFFSTLLVSLLSPLGLYLGAMLLTLIAPLGWIRKNRRRLATAFTLLFAFACTDFCGKSMLSALERLGGEVSLPPYGKPAVFIVLGGGSVAEGDAYQPSISSQRRLRRALVMMNEHSGSRLMLSGIEAPVIARWLGDVPLIMEPRSLNTRANILESAALLRRLYPDEKTRPAVCLVTDRFHTPRALLNARAFMGDFQVYSSPALSLVRKSPWRAFHFIPTSGGLAVTSMAWREILALSRDCLRERFVRSR